MAETKNIILTDTSNRRINDSGANELEINGYDTLYEAGFVGARIGFISDYVGSKIGSIPDDYFDDGSYWDKYAFKMAGSSSTQVISSSSVILIDARGKKLRLANTDIDLALLKTTKTLNGAALKPYIVPRIYVEDYLPIANGKYLVPTYTASYWVKIDDHYYLVFEEKSIIGCQVVNVNAIEKSQATFEPYEPTSSLSFTINYNLVAISGIKTNTQASCTTTNKEDTISETTSDWTVTSIPEYYTSSGTKRISFQHNRAVLQNGTNYSDLLVASWDSEEYLIECKDTNVKPYVGKPLTTTFAQNYRLIYRRQNEYKTVDSVTQENLNLNSIILPNGNPCFTSTDVISFSYKYTDSITVNYSNSDIYPIGLASGNLKFTQMYKISTAKVGDSIELNTNVLKNNSSLVYSDGTSIPLNDVAFNSTPTISAYVGNELIQENPFAVTSAMQGLLTISVRMSTRDFGDIGVYTYEVMISVDPKSVRLENAPHNFEVGDVYTLQGAKLYRYDEDGNIIPFGNLNYIPSEQFNGYVEATDNYYNNPLVLPDNFEDTPITTNFEYGGLGIYFQNVIYLSYYKDFSIQLPQELQGNLYLDSQDDFEDHLSGITLKITRVSNDNGDVTATTQDVEENYEITHSQLDLVNNDYQQVVIRATYKDFQDQKVIDVFRRKIIKIHNDGATDSTPYWDTISDIETKDNISGETFNYFHLPTGITFRYEYNDGSFENSTIPLSDLRYFTDEECTNEINTSSLLSENNTTIYVKDASGRKGSFFVAFSKKERVLSISKEVNETFTFIKGNRLSKYRNEIRQKYYVTLGNETGNSRTGYINDTFSIVDDDIVLNSSSQLQIRFYDTLLTLSDVTYANPTLQEVTINENGFKKTYINGADGVDCREITLTVTYSDAVYQQELGYADYTISSSVSELNNYVYDGSQPINLTMNESFTNVPLTFSFNELFTSSVESVQSSVEVMEVMEIIGINFESTKTDYKTGDEFLNETDNTKVILFYKDPNTDETKKYEMLLRNASSAININPTKGTILKNIGTRLVRVSSATSNASYEYSIEVSPQYVYDENKQHNLVAYEVTNNYLYNGELQLNGKYVLVSEGSKNELLQGAALTDGMIYGYLDDIFDKSKNAKVILFYDYLPLGDNTNNIDVVFPCYVEGNADYINKCQFGILFGNNNAKNRLFLSGNPSLANCDWHTGEVTSEQVDNDEEALNGNFGYFEDTSYCFYGETDNKVVGYDIVANDKLLVLKDKSDKETTVYFRTPVLVTAIDGAGTQAVGYQGETLYQEEFALTKGNNSVAGISPSSTLNFNGDSLFLSSDNNLVGLDLTGIVGDNQRYANTRSYFIDEDLKERDLTNSWLWSDNKYLLIMLPEKIYLTNFETKSEKQYEWWQVNVKGVEGILEYNGVIYFGNNEGKFFKIGNNYEDIEKIFLGDGSILNEFTPDYELNNKFVVSSSTIEKLLAGGNFKFKNVGDEPIYHQIGTIVNTYTSQGSLVVNDQENALELVTLDETGQLYDGRSVYLDRVEIDEAQEDSENLKSVGVEYYILEYFDGVSTSNPLFKLYKKATNQEVNIRYLARARLCAKADDEYDIVEIDETNSSFKLSDGKKVIDLITYGNQQTSSKFKCEILKYSNVEAYYITKPYSFGNLDYFKTIWQWTLTNDTNIPSELELTYASNKIPNEKTKTLRLSVDKFGLDFDKFTFTKVDYDKGIVPRTYTAQRILSKQKFICFGFKNYNNTNSVLSSMSILYSIPHASYGSD